jgi:hypothetical protein
MQTQTAQSNIAGNINKTKDGYNAVTLCVEEASMRTVLHEPVLSLRVYQWAEVADVPENGPPGEGRGEGVHAEGQGEGRLQGNAGLQGDEDLAAVPTVAEEGHPEGDPLEGDPAAADAALSIKSTFPKVQSKVEWNVQSKVQTLWHQWKNKAI